MHARRGGRPLTSADARTRRLLSAVCLTRVRSICTVSRSASRISMLSAQVLCGSRRRLDAAKPSETTSPCIAISSCWQRCEVDHPALLPSVPR